MTKLMMMLVRCSLIRCGVPVIKPKRTAGTPNLEVMK